MDSQNSSGLPFNHHHQQHHQLHHRPQPPPVFQHMPNNTYQHPPNTNDSVMHHPNHVFPFNSVPSAAAPPKPLEHNIFQTDGSSSGGGAGGFVAEAAKKKRGRPRKYSPDNGIGLGLSPAPVAGMAHNDSGGGGGPSSENNAVKRSRGRPQGSVKKQLNALGVPGFGFTPHVITVNPGEDIALKIVSFSEQGPRTVLVLSAVGSVCNATLRQPLSASGTMNYEGRFELISLTGSFQPSINNGNNHRTGGLSVSLAAIDGNVVGGGVAGILKAASRVQVVVGSFIAGGEKQKAEVPSSSAPPMLQFDDGNNFSPVGDFSDSDEENGDSILGGSYGQHSAATQNMDMYSSMGYSLPN